MVPSKDYQEVTAPCKQQAKLYHIRASCRSIIKGEECTAGESCTRGHDFPAQRREVEERRKEQGLINRQQARLEGQQESIKIAAKKAAAEKVAAEKVAAKKVVAEEVAAN